MKKRNTWRTIRLLGLIGILVIPVIATSLAIIGGPLWQENPHRIGVLLILLIPFTPLAFIFLIGGVGFSFGGIVSNEPLVGILLNSTFYVCLLLLIVYQVKRDKEEEQHGLQ